MKISSKLGGLVAVLGVAGMLLVTGGGSAQASEPIAPQAAAPVLAKDSVLGYNVKDGTLYGADIAPAVVKWFTGTYDNTVTTNSVKDGALGEVDLNAALQAKVNAPEVFGRGKVESIVEPTTIKNIGGKFADNATLVGKFDLPAGTWLVNTSAVFTRTVAGVQGTRPQIALRYGSGSDAGTAMGAEISPTANRELTASAVQTVILTEATTINIYGFGYNDDTSAAGSSEINVAAQTTAVRLG